MGDTRLYPGQSASTQKGRIIAGFPVDFGIAKTLRTRVTAAQINAGFTLLPALIGVKWRLIDLIMIAIAGTSAGATDVRLLATQSGAAVALGVAAVAGLTRSTVLRLGSPFATAGTASIVALTDGLSHVPNDPNTAVTVGKTGGTLITSTSIDFIYTFTADAQTGSALYQ